MIIRQIASVKSDINVPSSTDIYLCHQNHHDISKKSPIHPSRDFDKSWEITKIITHIFGAFYSNHLKVQLDQISNVSNFQGIKQHKLHTYCSLKCLMFDAFQSRLESQNKKQVINNQFCTHKTKVTIKLT